MHGSHGSFPGRFRTGVSLHSHTLHSRESLGFIHQAARHSVLLRLALRRGSDRYLAMHGSELDLNQGWWTPPLSPRDAFALEAAQLEDLNLTPLVSITDHDDIEAPISLQAVDASRQVPVSVEWTVPYGATFFHIGVHNISAQHARATMRRLAAISAEHTPGELKSLLADLHGDPATLVVFNHPLWDEKGVGAAVHRAAALDFVRRYRDYVHAFELNGLRPWAENRATIQFAHDANKPVVSGGDRHVVEPNAVINLTNAADFAEFAQEVRDGQWSNVLVMPQYREAHVSRIFHNIVDVFRTYENHSLGWTRWADRVFFKKGDGSVTSLTQLWGERPPAAVALFAGFMRLAAQTPVRLALRSVMSEVPTAAK